MRKLKAGDYRVTLYYWGGCSVSHPRTYSSDEEAIKMGLEELNDDPEYHTLEVQKYVARDDGRAYLALTPVYYYCDTSKKPKKILR